MTRILIQPRPLSPELSERLGPGRSRTLSERLLARALRWAEAGAPGEAGILTQDLGSGPLLVAAATCPGLAADHVRAAQADLAHGIDVAVGPATEGGWYLLALREPRWELLEGGGEGLARLYGQGLQVGLLRSEPTLSGIQAAVALAVDPLCPPELRELLGDLPLRNG